MKPAGEQDTIVAVATAPGEAGIGVVRLSGPESLRIADALFEPKSGILPSRQASWRAQVGRAVRRAGPRPEPVDEAVCLVMRAPKSYTREDTVEFSLHGGRLAVRTVVGLALELGARLAEPGEFTKRAFLNGRIDLAQAEAVLDLIRARSDRGLAAAREQLEGRLSGVVREARDALLGVLSHIEAAIDFPDDRLDPMADAEAAERLRAIRARIGEILARSREGLLVREGLKTALVGRPNVGKSSLMNALLGKDRMIVSDVPGTTRDTVEEELQVRGLAVRLVDTAGLGRAVSPLESAARARSEEAIASSDLVLFVVDGSEPPSEGDFAAWEGIRGKPRFLVVNKCDRLAAPALDGYLRLGPRGAVVRTSCRDGSGLAELEGRIASYVLEQAPERPAEAWLTSVRHAELFRKAHGHLADAAAAFERGLSGECAAVDVRLALDALGEVVGEAVTDDLLDRIFSRFCIGK